MILDRHISPLEMSGILMPNMVVIGWSLKYSNTYQAKIMAFLNVSLLIKADFVLLNARGIT